MDAINNHKPKIELLDAMNIIEVNRIRSLISDHPDLLALFEIIIMIVNQRINEE